MTATNKPKHNNAFSAFAAAAANWAGTDQDNMSHNRADVPTAYGRHHADGLAATRDSYTGRHRAAAPAPVKRARLPKVSPTATADALAAIGRGW